jgi:hypothetical protein
MGEGESSASEPRRRRGTRFTIGESSGNDNRGTGQTASQGEETPQTFESVETVSVAAPTRRGRKPDLTAAKGAADMMIGCVETFAYARYRTPEARMAPEERRMALEGLANSVKVLPAHVVGQISSLSAPVMCLMGFLLYANRLGELEARRRANRREDTVSSQAEEWLNQQPQPQPEYRHGPVADNGFRAPAKDMLSDLQEI